MRLICFGDSNTYGYDPRGFFGGRYDARDRWVDLVAQFSGWELYNAGENGRQIPSTTAPIDGDIFLVMLGTNDLLQGASAQEAAGRMEVFLKQLIPYYHKLLLLAPPPLCRGAWVPTDALVEESIRLGDTYFAVADKVSIPFIDTRSWHIPLSFDGVHFTQEGHRIFAEHLFSALCDL